jgi:flagellar protein FlaJ
MSVLLLCFGLLFTIGIYYLLIDVLRIPSRANTKAVLHAAKIGKGKASFFQLLLFRLSTFLAQRLTLSDYYKRKTAATLRSAGMSLTPEMFLSQAIVKAILLLCSAILMLPLFPLLSPILVFLAIAIFFKDYRAADEIVRKKREQIEMELPRFVATIAQELKASRDVLRMLEVYAHHANEQWQHELQMTIADMKSGSMETALLRLETRIGSTMLSDIVRGLLAVLRGDQGVVYFEMLAHDFKLAEIQKLKRMALKRPVKIRKYSFLMLACFMLVYMVVIGMEIMKAVGELF